MAEAASSQYPHRSKPGMVSSSRGRSRAESSTPAQANNLHAHRRDTCAHYPRSSPLWLLWHGDAHPSAGYQTTCQLQTPPQRTGCPGSWVLLEEPLTCTRRVANTCQMNTGGCHCLTGESQSHRPKWQADRLTGGWLIKPGIAVLKEYTCKPCS